MKGSEEKGNEIINALLDEGFEFRTLKQPDVQDGEKLDYWYRYAWDVKLKNPVRHATIKKLHEIIEPYDLTMNIHAYLIKQDDKIAPYRIGTEATIS